MLNSWHNQNTVQSPASSTLLLLPSTSTCNASTHFSLPPPPPKCTNMLMRSHLQAHMFLEASPDLAWVWGSYVPKHLVCFPVTVFITLSPFIYLSPLCTASTLKTRNVSFTFLYLYFWELIKCLGHSILNKCFFEWVIICSTNIRISDLEILFENLQFFFRDMCFWFININLFLPGYGFLARQRRKTKELGTGCL